MRRRERISPRIAGIGVAAALVLFVAVAFAGLPHPGGAPAQTITADVTSGGDLRDGDDVRVHGVRVGHVEDVDLAPDGRHARVRLAITDRAVRVHEDARLDLRWRTVLGGALYADLDPGTAGTPLLAGRHLPLAQTSAQVELDDVVAIAKGATPAAVRAVLREGAAALGDRSVVTRLLDVAPPHLRTVSRGLAPLRGERDGELTRLVRSGAAVAAATGADRHRLADIATGAGETFGTVASHRSALGVTLAGAPGALAATDRTLVRLGHTLDALDPVSAELPGGLRAVTRTLPDARRTLAGVTRTARAARPLLRELPRTVGDLAAAATPLRTVLEGARPVLDKSRDTLLPWLDTRDPQTKLKTYEAIGPTASVATHAEFDNGGFFLPFPADVDEEGLQEGPELPGLRLCHALLKAPTPTELTRCSGLERLFGGRLRVGKAKR